MNLVLFHKNLIKIRYKPSDHVEKKIYILMQKLHCNNFHLTPRV